MQKGDTLTTNLPYNWTPTATRRKSRNDSVNVDTVMPAPWSPTLDRRKNDQCIHSNDSTDNALKQKKPKSTVRTNPYKNSNHQKSFEDVNLSALAPSSKNILLELAIKGKTSHLGRDYFIATKEKLKLSIEERKIITEIVNRKETLARFQDDIKYLESIISTKTGELAEVRKKLEGCFDLVPINPTEKHN